MYVCSLQFFPINMFLICFSCLVLFIYFYQTFLIVFHIVIYHLIYICICLFYFIFFFAHGGKLFFNKKNHSCAQDHGRKEGNSKKIWKTINLKILCVVFCFNVISYIGTNRNSWELSLENISKVSRNLTKNEFKTLNKKYWILKKKPFFLRDFEKFVFYFSLKTPQFSNSPKYR